MIGRRKPCLTYGEPMVSIRRLGTTLGLAIAVGGLTVGCGSDGSAGPLGEATGTPDNACFGTDSNGAITKHVATFTADESVRLSALDVVDADNVAAVHPVVLPFAGNPSVTGTFLRYPPGSGVIADSLMRWSDRTPLAGAEVDPDDGQQAVLVGLRLEDAAEDGHLDGLRLEYADSDGDTFTRTYPLPLRLKTPGQLCTADDYR